MTTPPITLPAPASPVNEWITAPICGFDTETTGIDIRTDRIVTACLVNADNGVQVKNWLLDPGIEIPEGASNVHGITTAKARAEGQDYETGLAEIRDAILSYWAKGGIIVAYNAAYDFSILHHELKRVFGEGFPIAGVIFDPLVVDKAVDKFRKGSRKLVDTAALFGIDLTNAHSADADAIAAARIAWKMRQHPDMKGLNIMEWQKAKRIEQQTSLAKYLRGQGKDASDVSTEWPVVGADED